MPSTTSNCAPPTANAPCRVSIIIKALNEERGIEATIESALQAVSGLSGEVILADSCSTDRTIEIASRHPIRIVQLSNPDEKCCGIGPQLGFQHSTGEFVYILDGDMKILNGFLEEALAVMDRQPEVAGIGGIVVELNTVSLEYIAREQRDAAHRHAGQVDRLDSGGLYRRTAIDQAGYFSDRNLHSYEEYDLAVRLRALGWTLVRLPVKSVTHHGHETAPYRLLFKRWSSRYAFGLGELLRAAMGQPRLPMLVRGLRELRLYIAVFAWWNVLVGVWLIPVSVPARLIPFLGVLLFPVLVMGWRKKSISGAVYAVVSWCFQTAGLIFGLLQPRKPACERIESKVLKDLGGVSS
jgi:glycosyltransferase involved in cell wall biosynthesis